MIKCREVYKHIKKRGDPLNLQLLKSLKPIEVKLKVYNLVTFCLIDCVGVQRDSYIKSVSLSKKL